MQEKSGDVKPFEYNPVPFTPQHVDIAISHCGICGTDCHNIDSGWFPSVSPSHDTLRTSAHGDTVSL